MQHEHLGRSSLGASDVKVEVASFCAAMDTLVDQALELVMSRWR